MTGDEFSRLVLDALRVSPANFDGGGIEPESSRNASAVMTRLLCNRLGAAGERLQSRGRTTFEWRKGIINIRNAAHRKYWTNIRLQFAKEFHKDAQDHSSVYLLVWWNPLDPVMHVWAIPEHIVYGVLDRLPVGEDTEKRLVQLKPERNAFEKCNNCPDLTPYYSILNLAGPELSALTTAYKADVSKRQERSSTKPDVSEPEQESEPRIPAGDAGVPDVAGEQPADGSRERRYWAIGLGEEARLWPQCRQEGLIAIGWDQLGDLRRYNSQEEIAAALMSDDQSGPWPSNNSLACYQFCREMKPGDVVFAKQGRDRLLGRGVITGDYEYRPERAEYYSVRRVRWESEGDWEVPAGARVPIKTLTDVSGYREFLEFARNLPSTDQPQPTEPPYTIDRALEGVFLPKDEFIEMIASLGRKKNAILQGPPGVGKTFLARRLAYHLIGFEDPAKVAMVQFHQSYAYEDFVQGWRPNGQGGFDRRDGVFFEFSRAAAADPRSNYVFVIDEINRGNLSKVFGELFMLLEADKRGPDYAVPLTYARSKDEKFFVPKNLFVLGLMNTADRSLALVDYALRRRFTFIDLRPAFGDPAFKSYLTNAGVESSIVELVIDRMTRLNEAIRADDIRLGPGFEVGHSFFCPQQTEDSLGLDWYRAVVRTEIAPLLREYWFDDPAKAKKMVTGLLE